METLKLIIELLEMLFKKIGVKGLVFALIAFALFYIGYDRLLSIYLSEHRNWFAVAIISLCMILPAPAFYVLPHYFRELKLLRSADRPQLIDGKRIAVHGRLRSDEEPLVTPLTKQSCLYYDYSVHHYRTTKTLGIQGRQREPITELAGINSIPFDLHSSTGKLKLQLAKIHATERFQGKANDPEVKSNLDAYMKEAVFDDHIERIGKIKILPSGERKDYRAPGAMVEPWHYVEEHYIPVDAEVIIIGIWSSEFRGLVSEGITLNKYWVLKGSAYSAAWAVLGRIVRNILTALLVAAFINFFAFVILKSG